MRGVDTLTVGSRRVNWEQVGQSFLWYIYLPLLPILTLYAWNKRNEMGQPTPWWVGALGAGWVLLAIVSKLRSDRRNHSHPRDS